MGLTVGGGSYPRLLEARGYAVGANLCLAGTTVRDWQKEAPQPQPPRRWPVGGGIAIVELGTNGALGTFLEPGPIEGPEHRALMRQLIADLSLQMDRILIVVPVPHDPEAYRLHEYREIDFELCLATMAECVDPHVGQDQFQDRWHWDAAGHKSAADEIERVLVPEPGPLISFVAALVTLIAGRKTWHRS